MKYIAFSRPDGSVAIMLPLSLRLPKESEADWLERIAKQDVPVLLPDGTEVDTREAARRGVEGTQLPYTFVEEADIPNTREYRAAWEANGTAIQHNMTKCKELHRFKLRQLRGPKLQQLDGEFMKALGKDDKAAMAAVEAKRQALRDAPADPRIEAARTVAELRLVALPE